MIDPKPAILCDLDDTLVECGIYYRAARHDLFTLIQRETGVTATIVETVFNACEDHQKRQPKSHGRDRFPRSAMLTADLCQCLAGRGSHRLVQDAIARAEAVFDEPYALKPDAAEALELLRKSPYRLILVTQGDDAMQRSKVERHVNIDATFDVVYVLDSKTPDAYREVLKREAVVVEDSWMVGDSVLYDIVPAAAVGLHTAHLLTEIAYNPSYAQVGVLPTLTARSILDFAKSPLLSAPRR